MSSVFVFLLALLIFYGMLALVLAMGFVRTKGPEVKKPASLPLTIIICARNEEKNIGACLRSILDQEYDKAEIHLLLVNDASSDSTVTIAQNSLRGSTISFTVINNHTQKGKKKSLNSAIREAQTELIVLRDADTHTNSKLWLQAVVTCYTEQRSDLIIAPVALQNGTGFLWALQAIENNVLALFACGSAFYRQAFLCNGANLAFTRSIFEKVDGFSSHLHLVSGDDVLFLEEVNTIPDARISYLKSTEAIVSTYAQASVHSLFLQKIRWASKFKSSKSLFNVALALLTFAVNLGFLFSLLYCYFGDGHKTECALVVSIKTGIDILLLFLAGGFIKNRQLWFYVIPLTLLYPFYAVIVGTCAAILKPATTT